MERRFLLVITALLILCISCEQNEKDDSDGDNDSYKDRMREFVIEISDHARLTDSDFIIIPQNGIELVSDTGDTDGDAHIEYCDAISGNGQEDLFYGYDEDDNPTDSGDTEYLTELLDISKDSGNTILVTDYCSTHSNMDDSYSKNDDKGYISFAASDRDLNIIPSYPAEPYNSNADDITSLSEVQNFLYLIDPSEFTTKTEFIDAVTATNYDLLIMDLDFTESSSFTSGDTAQLKSKANGGTRLLICYMSIGEAEDYRYYWESDWEVGNPSFIKDENPDWEGNYKVAYWDEEWKDIIFSGNDSYLDRILAAGFDGAYLDIIDAFEYFE